MVYFRLSAMGLTAVAVLAVFVVLPSLPRHHQGLDPDLVRAYATYRRILVETGVIAGVKVEGGRLRVTPGARWYELSEELQRLHAYVLAEGLLGNRDAPCTIESPGCPGPIPDSARALKPKRTAFQEKL